MLGIIIRHGSGILLVGIAVVLMVMQLVETHPHLSWILDGFGKRVVENYENRQEKRRQALIAEAHALGMEIIVELMPPDYENVKDEIRQCGERLNRIHHEAIGDDI